MWRLREKSFRVEDFIAELKKRFSRLGFNVDMRRLGNTNILTIFVSNNTFSIHDDEYYVADMIFNPANKNLLVKFANTRDYPHVLSIIREIARKYGIKSNIYGSIM